MRRERRKRKRESLLSPHQVGEIPEDMEQMKFKEVEKRFLKQFNMPPEEKLVNCEELSATHMHLCPSLLQYPLSCSMYHLFVFPPSSSLGW